MIDSLYHLALYAVKNPSSDECEENEKNLPSKIKIDLAFVREEYEIICKLRKRKITLNQIDQKFHTKRVCLIAVNQNGIALEYVTRQTNEICLEAVKQDGYALEYAHQQTEEIC